MKVEIKKSILSPCNTEIFTINGVKAYEGYFGVSRDKGGQCSNEEILSFGCINRRFERVPCSEEVLKKYNITEKEYDEICDMLEDELDVGMCGWCI